MKKLESTLPNMVIVLSVVCLVSASLLGFMYGVTAEPIARIEKQTLENGIKKVILDEANQDAQINVEVREDGAFTFYEVTDAQGQKLGTAVKTAVQGFSPDLTVLVGFNTEGDIKGYEVLKHSETPGLGANCVSWFQKGGKGDIIGKNPGKNNLTVSKDGGEVDAITASTITSRAFLGAVNAEYQQLFGSKGTNATTGATQRHAECSGEKHCEKAEGCNHSCEAKADGEKCQRQCCKEKAQNDSIKTE
ncbi:MAG: RnfABCDGE type electron transport complex subunit G [Bacteroidales bacterium]|nr:RnfABCDGE type electron transport complex subunit G [Bacteroidales bacterium]